MAATDYADTRRAALWGHLAMLAFSGLVAGSFSLGSMVANEIAPGALNLVRFTIAAGMMGVFATASGQMTRASFAAPWRYLVLGALFASYFVLMFEALKTATPVSAAAVFTLTPAISAVFAYLLMRQLCTPRMAMALVIGAVGALWVIFRADLSALMAFEVGRGEPIFLLGCISHALYTPLSRMLNRGEHAFTYTFGVLCAAVVVLAIYGGPAALATDWGALPPLVWVTILYTAIFAGATSTTLMQFATLHLPSAKVMAYTYLTPTWVTLWELLQGRPLPPVTVMAGVALAVLALVILLKHE